MRLTKTSLMLSVGLGLILGACSEPSTATSPPSQDMGTLNLVELMDCTREQDATLLSAHRAGPRPGVPENSISAIRASLDDGVMFFEIDVTQSADGHLFLLHDRTLDRTTTGTGNAQDAQWEEISQLVLLDNDGNRTEETPPSLAEVLQELDGKGIAQLDLKGVSPEMIVDAVREAGAQDRVLIITYNTEQALAIHALAPEIMLSAGMRNADDLQTFRDAGVDLTKIVAWLGLGHGDPEFDQVLADQGIETSYADFRGENDPNFDYVSFAANGAEIISVDHVEAASSAINAGQIVNSLLSNCIQ